MKKYRKFSTKNLLLKTDKNTPPPNKTILKRDKYPSNAHNYLNYILKNFMINIFKLILTEKNMKNIIYSQIPTNLN